MLFSLPLFLFFFFGVLFILIRKYAPYIRGNIGEWVVNNALGRLNGSRYKVMNNLLLPSGGNTELTQIDHLVVSNYGIFAIETKAHMGWIFGNGYDKYWTEVIFRDKFRFYNPVRQNYAHTKAVEDIVRVISPRIPIIGFVVFPFARKLKITGTDRVVPFGDIVLKILQYNVKYLSDDERDLIINKIDSLNIKDSDRRAAHVNAVRKNLDKPVETEDAQR